VDSGHIVLSAKRGVSRLRLAARLQRRAVRSAAPRRSPPVRLRRGGTASQPREGGSVPPASPPTGPGGECNPVRLRVAPTRETTSRLTPAARGRMPVAGRYEQ
jgi:hypothetical protein